MTLANGRNTHVFNQPSGGSGFLPAKEMYGHLVLFTKVHREEQRPDNLRQGQLQRVVIVDYVDLDEPGQPLHSQAMVGNVGITNKLEVGATNVLGRISSMDTGKGQPAWILIGYDENGNDVARATQWVNAYTAASMQQPPQQQAPVPQAAPQPQYQPAPVPQAQPQYQPQQQYAPQAAPVQQQVPQAQPVAPTPAEGGQVDFAAVQALLAQQGLVQGQQPAPNQQPGY